MIEVKIKQKLSTTIHYIIKILLIISLISLRYYRKNNL